MKKRAVLLAIFIIPIAIFSQQSSALVVNLTQSNNNYQFNKIFTNTWTLDNFFLRPFTDQFGISYRKESNKNYFIELMTAGSFTSFTDTQKDDLGRPIEGMRYNARYTDLHVRLELGKMWSLSFHPGIEYGIAASVDPRHTYRNYTPFSNVDYPFDLKTKELTINAIPQLKYSISDKFLVLVKVPLEIYSHIKAEGVSLNTNFSQEEQNVIKTFSNVLLLIPNFTIGAGYFLSHSNH